MSLSTKAAWTRIRERLEAVVDQFDRAPMHPESSFMAGYKDTAGIGDDAKSIHDLVQAEYREGRITEAERDEMRRHIKTWLGDPDAGRGAHVGSGFFRDSNHQGYETYSCGLWVPTAAPYGEVEHGIVLMAVTIMELEDDPVSSLDF